jgi:hypothetical protein
LDELQGAVHDYVIIDDILKAYGVVDDCRAVGTAAEILTIGVIAAKYFRNHHERTLCLLSRLGYVHGLSVSRFNRRLHTLRDWLYRVLVLISELYAHGDVFILDSMPLPVCKRARASRCRKVRGKAFCGYCAAKKEKFFGWRLHLLCTSTGIPVNVEILPAAEQDLTPIHELTFGLPEGASVLADKVYISTPDALAIFTMTGVRFVAARGVTWLLIHGRMSMTFVSIGNALKQPTANWSRWAFSNSMPAPIMAST